MIRGLFSIFLSLLPLPLLQAAPSSDGLAFLGSEDRLAVLRDRELVIYGQGLSDLRLWKSAPFAQAVAEGYAGKETSIAVEGLFLTEIPASLRGPDLPIRLFNSLNAVSSMEGLLYYSVTRQKTEPLILSSWRVASMAGGQRLPDQSFSVPPASLTTVVFQKDNRMGDGYTELKYQFSTEQIVLTLTNLTTMSYGFLPLVDPKGMTITFVVRPLEDHVLVYAVSGVKTVSLFGLEKGKEQSFFYRMKALAGWAVRGLAGR